MGQRKQRLAGHRQKNVCFISLKQHRQTTLKLRIIHLIFLPKRVKKIYQVFRYLKLKRNIYFVETNTKCGDYYELYV